MELRRKPAYRFPETRVYRLFLITNLSICNNTLDSHGCIYMIHKFKDVFVEYTYLCTKPINENILLRQFQFKVSCDEKNRILSQNKSWHMPFYIFKTHATCRNVRNCVFFRQTLCQNSNSTVDIKFVVIRLVFYTCDKTSGV